MNTDNPTTTFTSVQTLEDRALIEASRQQHELRESYEYVSKLPKSRLVRHAVLVNARHVLAYDIIDFYSRRYNGVPATAPAVYTHEQAIADAQAAGLRYHVARRISLDAVAAGLTGAEYRAFVDAHIDMRKDAQAADRARNAAKWAQVQAVGA